MVFGATGSVGDGLLKAAIEDPDVEKVYVVTRSTSPRIEAGASGKVEIRLHQDFTDYSSLADILGEVNTVLWGLGTTSLGMDDETYTRIHVDFPVAFVNAWLAARGTGRWHSTMSPAWAPIATEQHWAREKGRAEREVAELAEGSGLRTFGYRSAFIRPSSEQANAMHYFTGDATAPGRAGHCLGRIGCAMLEISARTTELPNATIIDNADSIAYAQAYQSGQ